MSNDSALSAYYTTRRSDVRRFLPDNFSRVLEIGCSSGGFGEGLLSNGVQVWGVEPNEAAAKVARSKLTRVFNATFEQAANDLPDRYFDLIVCNDVIEHMPDHDRFLQSIKSKMTERGVLVGSLPNIRHITSLAKILILKDFPYRDQGILDRTHLRFFTRKSIRRTLRQNGYKIESFRGVNSIIVEGICGGSFLQNLFWRFFTSAVVVLTLGYFADVAFPQYGFRASLKE
jgi:2-polyprenyl-3-methyl-5-hydroxy-6-metoxy-1,4-benzoquinol methylase